MGSLGDNGGGWPPDGLPEVPPEWGEIVIPDDLSALSDEVAAVRAELGQSAPRTPWRRFADRPAVRGLHRILAAGVRAPVLIITMAVLVTIASVFASDWNGPARPSANQRSAGNPENARGPLPALELDDGSGQNVPLRGRLPAVVLVTDGCDCATLVTDTATAVRPDITVITVTSGPRAARSPSRGIGPVASAEPEVPGRTIRRLWDPTGELRAAFRLAEPDGTATALLVDRDGDILRVIPGTVSVEELRPDLARL